MGLKKYAVFTALVFCILALQVSAPSWAGQSNAGHLAAAGEKKPVLVSPGHIALLFHRLTGAMPDFDKWAEASDAYITAPSFDKLLIREEKVRELKKIFSLLTLTEPIFLQKTVKLSPYSRSNLGFFIEDLKPDTYFGFPFLNENYAIIPLSIMEKQWIKVENPEQAAAIANASNLRHGEVNLVLHVVPMSADKTAPMMLEGRNHWLISAEVRDVALYQVGTDKLLWQSDERPVNDQVNQELLGLFK